MLLGPCRFGGETEVKTCFDSSHEDMQWDCSASPPGQSESSDNVATIGLWIDYVIIWQPYWIMSPCNFAIVPLVLGLPLNSHQPLVVTINVTIDNYLEAACVLRKSRIHLNLFTVTFDATLSCG